MFLCGHLAAKKHLPEEASLVVAMLFDSDNEEGEAGRTASSQHDRSQLARNVALFLGCGCCLVLLRFMVCFAYIPEILSPQSKSICDVSKLTSFPMNLRCFKKMIGKMGTGSFCLQ